MTSRPVAPRRGAYPSTPSGAVRVAGAVALALAAATAIAGAAGPALAAGMERVSVGPSGGQADGHSYEPVVSADGRLVAFISDATSLAPGDTNRAHDVFVHDRGTRKTRRVSVGPGGRQGDGPSYDAAISADGRFVAFASAAANLVPGDANGETDVFVRDRRASKTTTASVGSSGVQGDGFSGYPAISADGRHVAFQSGATNLVPGDTNGVHDIFVRTR